MNEIVTPLICQRISSFTPPTPRPYNKVNDISPYSKNDLRKLQLPKLELEDALPSKKPRLLPRPNCNLFKKIMSRQESRVESSKTVKRQPLVIQRSKFMNMKSPKNMLRSRSHSSCYEENTAPINLDWLTSNIKRPFGSGSRLLAFPMQYKVQRRHSELTGDKKIKAPIQPVRRRRSCFV